VIAPRWWRPGPALRTLGQPGRLVRYAVAGGFSALTHLGVLAFLVEAMSVRPVVASAIGFLVSILVSYTLQRCWVFDSPTPMWVSLPRFLAVIAVGFALNAAVMFAGTEVFDLHYLWPQALVFLLVPLSNYSLNTLWTFRAPTTSGTG
jgi:putative flippase GtrA